MKFLKFASKCLSVFLCMACSESESIPEINYSVTVDRDFIKFAYKDEKKSFIPFEYEAINDESKMLIFDHELAIENFSLDTEFEILSDGQLLISTGTDFGYMKIDNNFVSIFKSGKDFKNNILNERIKLSTQLKKGVKYRMGFKKDLTGVTFYLIGNSLSFKKYYTNDDDLFQSAMRGKPRFQIFEGNFKVFSSVLSSDYEKEPRVSIYGDSFIEGFALYLNRLRLENRWCSKFADAIGVDNCLIDGKGGDKMNQLFLERFKIENSWYKSKYVIISLGTNNKNPSEYFENIKEIISILKSNNQIPILVTVTPRPDFEFYKTGYVINKWIKSSGEVYVDMNKAVTNDNDPSTWKNDYVLQDGTHPTVKAYMDMYNQLRNDCPFIF